MVQLNVKPESLQLGGSIAAGCGALYLLSKLLRSGSSVPPRSSFDYDVIIVGGSVAGPTMAKALSDQGRKVLVIERSLWEKPDRIVGELLQPGGLLALEKLGMQECASNIGSTCTGYMVIDEHGQHVSLPYEEGHVGYSFHFGDFVNNLRRYVWYNCKQNVTMVEGTVTDIASEGVGCYETAYGVTYLREVDAKPPAEPFQKNTDAASAQATHVVGERKRESVTVTAPLIILCDGGASKFKSRVNHFRPARNFHSNFVGLILKGIQLPEETRGHVFFGKTGPILSYRLDPNEVRFLVDYNKPELPSLPEQVKWLKHEVAPRLPENIREEFIRQASDEKNLRSMAVARYPQLFPVMKGLVGIGDHANQRHPLTGGGMTVAFRDVLRLAEALAPIPVLRSDDAKTMTTINSKVQAALTTYCRTRFLHSSCINILSWALYAVFGTPNMRNACFDYFLLGGDAVRGPMALLSGLDPSPLTLAYHYTKVMLNGAWNMMAKTGSYTGTKPGAVGIAVNVATFFINPIRLYKAIALLIQATSVFTPLAWMEFVSIWRYADPTGSFARFYRGVEYRFLRTACNAKAGKPVGL